MLAKDRRKFFTKCKACGKKVEEALVMGGGGSYVFFDIDEESDNRWSHECEGYDSETAMYDPPGYIGRWRDMGK